MHRPRKRFGQNFLHDPGVIGRIVAAIGPRPGERVVEIGPGLGAITRPLLEALGEMDAVELDRDLIAELRALPGLRVHEADALRFDFCTLTRADERLRVVGNLPYNISTPLLFHLLDQARCIRDMHFMLQKEVVDRMVAAPDCSDYGRLSVMVQYRCRVERVLTVPPGAFNPPPKVHSAVVRLTPHEQPPVDADPDRLREVVALAFAHRRKTLRNNLKGRIAAERIEAIGVDPGRRAETLSLAEFAALAAELES